jgi:protein CpxP
MQARLARWLFFAVLGVAGIFMTAPGCLAQAAGGGPGMRQGLAGHRPPFERAFRFHGMAGRFWDNPRIAAALKLTPDQQKAMDNILFQHREKLIDLQANLQKAELDMEPLMNADEPNQAAIEAQINKVVAARGALEKANANFLLALRMKLTPDQWKEIKNFRAEGGMHQMQRHWGPDGPGQRMRMRGPNGPNGGPTPESAPPAPPQGGNQDSGSGSAAQQ